MLVDADDRILLIRIEDPAISEPDLWITPGGACESAESPAEAARRELIEETGICVTDVEPCIWRRRHRWKWADQWIDSDERFFFCRIGEPPNIDPAGSTQLEMQVIRDYRWWTALELQNTSHETFVPRRLAQLIAPLLRGEIPAEPIDVGI